MYVNGSQVDTDPQSGSMSNVSQSVMIGAEPNISDYCNGLIDDVRIYDRALSAQEVQDLYEEGAYSLVAHWKFDEGTGSTAYDETANNNDGTITGATWTTGKFDDALDFDGSWDYVELDGTDGSTHMLNVGELAKDDFSISLWHKKNDTGQGVTDLIGDYDFSKWWLIWFSANTTIRFGVDDGTNNPKSSTTVTDDTNWHHVVAIWDKSSNTVNLYWDGVFKNSDTVANFNPGASTSPVQIGAGGTSRTSQQFNGKIDEDTDFRYEAELKLDHKELAEHMMLVDLARNDIAHVAEPGSRVVTELLIAEKYESVQHLVSNVKGTLARNLDALSAYLATMNMGTLTGAPKIEAMKIIRLFEKTKRGYYGGAVCYLTVDGQFDSCITIRSLQVRDHMAYIRVGAGIVHDSVPKTEFEETEHKAGSCLRAIRGE